MTDYLSALSHRARAPAAVRPRPPERFEPAGMDEVKAPGAALGAARNQPQHEQQSVAVVPAPAPPSSFPASRLSAEPQVAEISATRSPTSPVEPVLSRPLTSLPAIAVEAIGIARPLQLQVPVAAPTPTPTGAAPLTLETRHTETRVIERLSHELRVEPGQLTRELLERRVERIANEQLPVARVEVNRPVAPARLDGAATAATPAAAGRLVEISIGRIEIVAGPAAPAPPERAQRPKASEPQGLESYLLERSASERARGGRA